MNYKCIKSFAVDVYDENDNVVENEQFVVEYGGIWEREEYSYMSDVRLTNNDGRWLEIPLSDLYEHFLEERVDL